MLRMITRGGRLLNFQQIHEAAVNKSPLPGPPTGLKIAI
jgi:hypothetical protein